MSWFGLVISAEINRVLYNGQQTHYSLKGITETFGPKKSGIFLWVSWKIEELNDILIRRLTCLKGKGRKYCLNYWTAILMRLWATKSKSFYCTKETNKCKEMRRADLRSYQNLNNYCTYNLKNYGQVLLTFYIVYNDNILTI